MTEEELRQKAIKLAGLSIGELAERYQLTFPTKNLLHMKGKQGQLLEWALGTTAGNQSLPDFKELGIELKTIPINQNGLPKETTYVAATPLMNIQGLTWHQSVVYKKLRHVLYIPIEADPEIPIPKRMIGMPCLWELTPAQEAILKQDWEEHMTTISSGGVESITAHQGQYLQIRPKAANAQARTKAIGPDGNYILTNPRGFYLRTAFTKAILQQSYL